MTIAQRTTYRTPAELVTEFHSTYGQPIRVTPQLDVPERKLRVALITEEFEEYTEAEDNDDIVEIFDALGDEVYVAQGAAITHGIDLAESIRKASVADSIPDWLREFYDDYQNGLASELYFVDTNLFADTEHLNEGLVWDLTAFAAQRAGNREALGAAVGHYVTAELTGDIEALADALGEIIVTCYAISASYGIDLDIILEEIQRSNMSKLGADGKPIYYTDGPKKGKVMKGPNFSEPDIAAVLSALGERGTKHPENPPQTI